MRISDWSSDVCSSDLEQYVPALAGDDLPRAAVADRDVLDMLIGREGDHDLIAGGAQDFDDLVALIIDRLHACVASAGLRAHLRYGGRGRHGEQDCERAREHGRTRPAPDRSGPALPSGPAHATP